jgi:hypothetical protein
MGGKSKGQEVLEMLEVDGEGEGVLVGDVVGEGVLVGELVGERDGVCEREGDADLVG